MRLIFWTFALLISLPLQAETIKLATVKSDTDNLVGEFFLNTNHRGELDGMRYFKKNPAGQIVKDESYTAAEILNGPIVLEEREGREIIRLEPEALNVSHGGKLRLDFLYNGVRSTRKILKLGLKRLDEGFILTNSQGETINALYVRGNWIAVFGLVGVRAIETSYAE